MEMTTSERFLIDACALIAYFKGEEGCEKMRRFFESAVLGEVSLSMSIVTLLEVYYGFYRDNGLEKAESVLKKTLELPIQIIETFGYPELHEAGRIKAHYKISFADMIVLSIASVSGQKLLTSDHHEFDIIEQNENIIFEWIR
jgi:predicted nucleic acid-binding protein